jgi:Tfp pilus assembly protein PilF
VIKTPPPTPTAPTRPGLVRPGFDESRVLAAAHELLKSGQWTPARQAFHALATRVPSSRHYRALLAYAKARETLADRRPDDARLELEHALQLDPELTMAKDALAELFGK